MQYKSDDLNASSKKLGAESPAAFHSASPSSLIECLLPKIVADESSEIVEQEKSEDAISDLSKIILMDQEMVTDRDRMGFFWKPKKFSRGIHRDAVLETQKSEKVPLVWPSTCGGPQIFRRYFL